MQLKLNQPDFDSLRKHVESIYNGNGSFIHGFKHVQSVEQNGICLARQSGANLICVRLFALFHDIRRENDGIDPKHGKRAAEYICQNNGILFRLDKNLLAKLIYACEFHADGLVSEDLTIGTCWDADRLDLIRIGINPQIELLSTEAAKEFTNGRQKP
jgi:uncharacterized protein